MAKEELGKFEVGVALNLQDLVNKHGEVLKLLRGIEQQLQSIQSQADRTKQAVTGFGFAMVKFNAILGVAGKAIGLLKAGFNTLRGAINSAIGMFHHIIGAAAQWASQLSNQASLLGANTELVQGLRAGLDLVGASAHSATTIFRFLTRSINAMVGKGGVMSAKDAMKELKVSVIDSRGYIKDTASVLEELRIKLMAMPEGAQRTAMAMSLFGREGGLLLNMFNELTATGKTWQQYLKDLGLVIDKDLIARAAALDVQLSALKQQSEVTWKAIGAAAAPAFTELAREIVQIRAKILEWIYDNQESIEEYARMFADRLRELVEYIRGFMDALAGSDVPAKTFETTLNLVSQSLLKFGRAVIFALDFLNVLKSELLFFAHIAGWFVNIQNPLEAWNNTNADISKLEAMLYAAEAAQEQDEKRASALRHQSKQLSELVEKAKQLKQDMTPPTESPDVGPVRPQMLDPEYLGFDEINQYYAKNRLILEDYNAHIAHLIGNWRTLGADVKDLSKDIRQYAVSIGVLTAEEAGLAEKQEEQKEGLKGIPAETYAAMEALKKMSEQLGIERAMILGGTEARVRAQLQTEELREASEDAKNTYVLEVLALEDLKRAHEKMSATIGLFEPDARADASHARAASMAKKTLDLEIQRAKNEKLYREEVTLSSQQRILAAEEGLYEEQKTIGKIAEIRASLDEANSESAQMAVAQARELGIVVREEHEKSAEALKRLLDEELNSRRMYVEDSMRLERALTAAIEEEQMKRVERQEGATLQLRSMVQGALDDMYEGAILGTRKMDEVWDALWATMQKTMLKALVDMWWQKLKWEDDVILNFKTLPDKLKEGFMGIVDAFKGIWKLLFSDKAAEEQKAIEETTKLATATDALTGQPTGVPPQQSTQQIVENTNGVFDMWKTLPPAPETAEMAEEEEKPPAPPAPPQQPSATGEAAANVVRSFEDIGAGLKQLGKILVKPLEELWVGVTKGFQLLTGTSEKGTKDTTKAVSASGKGVSTDVGSAVGAVGSLLSNIGNMVGGSFGKVINIIMMVIQAIFAIGMMIATAVYTDVQILGFGQTGGYVGPKGFTPPTGGSRETPKAAARGIRGWLGVHDGEILINPRASALLGGKEAANELNAGRLPMKVMQRLADLNLGSAYVPVEARAAVQAVSVRVSAPGPAVERTSNQTSSATRVQSNQIVFGEGAIQVNGAVDGEDYARRFARSLVTEFGR